MLVDRTFFVARKWSNAELRKVAPLLGGDVVNVSSWEDRDKEGGFYKQYFTAAQSYSRTNHTGSRGFQGASDEIALDLTAPLEEGLHGRFDVVFNHTTLEHIFDVGTAFANLCKLSRDVVVVVVPFSQLQHESDWYADYWRFTPTCLRELFRQHGMTVVYESESPHKNAAIYLLFVAAKHPERHAKKMPKHKPIRVAGRWIGASLVVSGLYFARHRARKLLAALR